MTFPDSIQYCVIGGGVHGLSTAWHLAKTLEQRQQGSGRDIVLLEKHEPGSGASGIACGVVRNFYFSPAMTELVRLSVDVWKSDPETFGFHPVGYIAAVPKAQVADLIAIYGKEQEVGYTSRLYHGERECANHMRTMFADFHCEGIEAVLHEELGGYAIPSQTVAGLRKKVLEHGVRILSGVEVTGFDVQSGGVTGVETSHGRIRADLVVIGAGPWAGHFWKMLGLPPAIDCMTPHGNTISRPMWTYWQLREGSIETERPFLQDDGSTAPVIHLDHSIPLVDSESGEQVDPGPWGIYWKKDATGVQGGGVPIPLGSSTEIEPYGRACPQVDIEFQKYFRAGLAWAMDRFKADGGRDQQRPNGGIGCFTPDNYPVIDFVKPNVLLIADPNHGFKLLGVGKEVAEMIVDGRSRSSLAPFALERYATGKLHPSSQSPFPWN
ncbi:MAG TPA: FAD-binding oxidoreductase [Bryobacteraceae bacterium]|nr:FAD-binding oxidoreductase [Bryobacteraceae bacterium]